MLSIVVHFLYLDADRCVVMWCSRWGVLLSVMRVVEGFMGSMLVSSCS